MLPAVQFAVSLANVTTNASIGLVGAALEDINFSLYPGLYSQLIFGESFEEAHLQGITLAPATRHAPPERSWAACADDGPCHATWAVPAIGYTQRSAVELATAAPHTGKQALALITPSPSRALARIARWPAGRPLACGPALQGNH